MKHRPRRGGHRGITDRLNPCGNAPCILTDSAFGHLREYGKGRRKAGPPLAATGPGSRQRSRVDHHIPAIEIVVTDGMPRAVGEYHHYVMDPSVTVIAHLRAVRVDMILSHELAVRIPVDRPLRRIPADHLLLELDLLLKEPASGPRVGCEFLALGCFCWASFFFRLALSRDSLLRGGSLPKGFPAFFSLFFDASRLGGGCGILLRSGVFPGEGKHREVARGRLRSRVRPSDGRGAAPTGPSGGAVLRKTWRRGPGPRRRRICPPTPSTRGGPCLGTRSRRRPVRWRQSRDLHETREMKEDPEQGDLGQQEDSGVRSGLPG